MSKPLADAVLAEARREPWVDSARIETWPGPDYAVRIRPSIPGVPTPIRTVEEWRAMQAAAAEEKSG